MKNKLLTSILTICATPTIAFSLTALTSCGGNKKVSDINFDDLSMRVINKMMTYYPQVCSFPRATGHTDQIRAFIQNTIKDNGHTIHSDEFGNFWFDLDATIHYQNCSKVILMGQLDSYITGCSDEELINSGQRIVYDEKTFKIHNIDPYKSFGASNASTLSFILAISALKELPHPAMRIIIGDGGLTNHSTLTKIKKEIIDSRFVYQLTSESLSHGPFFFWSNTAFNATLNNIQKVAIDKKNIYQTKFIVDGLMPTYNWRITGKGYINIFDIVHQFFNEWYNEFSFDDAIQLIDVKTYNTFSGDMAPTKLEFVVATSISSDREDDINKFIKELIDDITSTRPEEKGLTIGYEYLDKHTDKAYSTKTTNSLVNMFGVMPSAEYQIGNIVFSENSIKFNMSISSADNVDTKAIMAQLRETWASLVPAGSQLNTETDGFQNNKKLSSVNFDNLMLKISSAAAQVGIMTLPGDASGLSSVTRHLWDLNNDVCTVMINTEIDQANTRNENVDLVNLFLYVQILYISFLDL